MYNKVTENFLKYLEPNNIFAFGITTDNVEGINMFGTNTKIFWVAKRGLYHDWAVYISGDFNNYLGVENKEKNIFNKNTIVSHGNKCPKYFLKNLDMKIDEDALSLYRG